MKNEHRRNPFFLLLVPLLMWRCSDDNLPPGSGGEVESQALLQVDPVDTEAVPFERNVRSSLAGTVLTYEQQQGKNLYIKFCALCHGANGKGDGFNALNLDPEPRDFTDARYMNALSNERLVETISQGGRGVNRSVLMPSWGGRLSKDEIEFLVSYVRLFSKSSYNEE